MANTGIAKIFMHGRSQAVRLPLAFRLPGDRVRVRRVEGGILLEPIITDIDAWFAGLDHFADVGIVAEFHICLLQLAFAFRVDEVGSVDHDFADGRVVEQLLDGAEVDLGQTSGRL